MIDFTLNNLPIDFTLNVELEDSPTIPTNAVLYDNGEEVLYDNGENVVYA